MRPISFILSASVLALASSAGAQTESYLSTQSGVTSRVQVIAEARPFEFRIDQADWISGAYAMSNGWRLQVEPTLDGIAARIDKRHPIDLVAVSPDKYITSDGNIWMEFNRGRQGDEMLMSYVPDARTARVVVIGSTSASSLAQR